MVVHSAGAAPVIEQITLEGPRGDEVLVRISATGICHTDLACAEGSLHDAFPAVFGHEAAGHVEAVGPLANRFRPGDAVVISVAHHCGHCGMCERGYPPLCRERGIAASRYHLGDTPIIQAYGTGTFAEATVVRERSVVAAPPDIPPAVAAATGCAVVTGFGAVTRVARVRPGSCVAVLGCGGVGVSTIMAAGVVGAARVVAVDPSAERRRAAVDLAGATDAVHPDEAAIRALVPDGFDYVFECAGRIEAMELGVSLAAMAGTVILAGLPSPAAQLSLRATEFVVSGKRLLGCNMGQFRPNVDFDAIFGLYRRGRLPLDALVGECHPLADAATAFAAAAAGASARVFLTP